MKRVKLFVSSFMLIFFINSVCGITIPSVSVKGSFNVKEKVILKEVKTKTKESYPEDILREKLKTDVENILALGYFDDVSVEFDTYTYKVVFIVDEKPLIKKLDFKGNKIVSNGKIRGEIANKKGEYLDKSKLGDDVNKILDLYSEKGYADTDVAYDTYIDKVTNQVNLTFFVIEGRKVVTEQVIIEGTMQYKEKKIVGLMKTKKKKIFKEKVFNEDIVKIVGFYKERGFESVQISTPAIEFNEERTRVNIKLTVNEGLKYRIGKISFSGNTVYPEKELLKVVDIRSNQLYSQSKLDSSLQGISEIYSDKGYLQAVIEPKTDKQDEKGLINVEFSITENNIAYLGKIYIDGLSYTKEYVIRREIQLNEDEPFSGVKLRRSMEKIYNLGFIDDVNVDLERTETPDTVDLVLTVTEGKPGMLQAGAGYSSVDQLVGSLQVNHMNLFGRAQRLNLLWEFGARKQNYEIGWTEPWFMHKPVSLGVSLFNTERQIYSGDSLAVTQLRQGAELRVGPRFSEYSSLWFIYSYEKVNNSNIQPGYEYVFDPVTQIVSGYKEGTALVSSLTTKFEYDRRDNIFDPKQGSRNSISLQLAGGPFGGDVEFYKPIVRSSWFLPTIWKFVFSINTTFGFVEGLNGYELADPTYKFFVGGADTVRGYAYNDLTPGSIDLVSGANIRRGGRFMFVNNIEYKFPIVTEKRKTILQGAFFYDFGGGWDKFGDMNLTIGATDKWRQNGEWDNLMKAGWGFGIRFTTPVFPIRLDWGWPLHSLPGMSVPQFYFTIGQIF